MPPCPPAALQCSSSLIGICRAHEGVWYFEVDIQHLGETGRCRVGWQQRGGELQAPVGYDKVRGA